MRATTNPLVLAAFFGASVGGASLVAWGSQAVTDAAAAETRKDLEDLKRRDFETARYARHSKAALGQMFDSVRGAEADEAVGDGRAVMKLPPIQWHPGAIAREERAKLAASAAAEEAATASRADTGRPARDGAANSAPPGTPPSTGPPAGGRGE